MLRKSDYTDLRSNIIVETDGVRARGIDGFPDNPTICIFKMRVTLSQVLSVSLLQEHPIATSLNSCRTASGITSNIRLKS
jgi:hypothetical protein